MPQAAIPALILSGRGPLEAAAPPAQDGITLAAGTRVAVRIVAILAAKPDPAQPAGTRSTPAGSGQEGTKDAPGRTTPGGAAQNQAEAVTGSAPPAGPSRAPAASAPAPAASGAGTFDRQAAPSPADRPAASPATVQAEGRVSGVTSDGRAIITSSFGTIMLERPGYRIRQVVGHSHQTA